MKGAQWWTLPIQSKHQLNPIGHLRKYDISTQGYRSKVVDNLNWSGTATTIALNKLLQIHTDGKGTTFPASILHPMYVLIWPHTTTAMCRSRQHSIRL